LAQKQPNSMLKNPPQNPESIRDQPSNQSSAYNILLNR
jgi:hypothetical protein